MILEISSTPPDNEPLSDSKEVPSGNRRLQPDALLKGGFLLGIIMIAAAIFQAEVLRSNYHWQSEWYPLDNALPEILAGSIAGLLTAMLMDYLTPRLESLRQIRERLCQTFAFENLQSSQAIIMGFLAAFPEEMLFRGAMQEFAGLFLTALIFGFLHAITRTYFFYATLLGLGLGVLVIWRGNLWAATAAHLVYDTTLFFIIARYAIQSCVKG